MPTNAFPKGFLWGVATSAPQIEGAVREGGRGESIWDRFAATPGKIEDGSDPSRACDHFHRRRFADPPSAPNGLLEIGAQLLVLGLQ